MDCKDDGEMKKRKPNRLYVGFREILMQVESFRQPVGAEFIRLLNGGNNLSVVNSVYRRRFSLPFPCVKERRLSPPSYRLEAIAVNTRQWRDVNVLNGLDSTSHRYNRLDGALYNFNVPLGKGCLYDTAYLLGKGCLYDTADLLGMGCLYDTYCQRLMCQEPQNCSLLAAN
ncbi:hypothetical protein Btru_065211 [Bulinus truncatus]|nr:hypothetical protein Btru_065211 [Bulinus truncatus]